MPLKRYEQRLGQPRNDEVIQVSVCKEDLEPPPYLKKYKPKPYRLKPELKAYMELDDKGQCEWVLKNIRYWPQLVASVVEAAHASHTRRGQDRLKAEEKKKKTERVKILAKARTAKATKARAAAAAARAAAAAPPAPAPAAAAAAEAEAP